MTDNDTVQQVQCGIENKSAIFINPKILKSIQSRNEKINIKFHHDSHHGNSHHDDISKASGKIFINPHFRTNTTNLTSDFDVKFKKMSNCELKHCNRNQETNKNEKYNDFLKTNSGGLHTSVPLQISHCAQGSSLGSKHSKQPSSNKMIVPNSSRIFINPDFSSSSKSQTEPVNVSSQKFAIRSDSHSSMIAQDCVLSATTKPMLKDSYLVLNHIPSKLYKKDQIIEGGSALNKNGKRQLCMDKDDIAANLSAVRCKMKKLEESKDPTSKIYFNPRFEDKFKSFNDGNSVKKIDPLPSKMEKLNSKNTSSDRSSVATFDKGSSSKSLSVKKYGYSFDKGIGLSYKGHIQASLHQKKLIRKSLNQSFKVDNPSTLCLNTSRVTKKKKLNENPVDFSPKKISGEPVILSKTKLIKNVNKKYVAQQFFKEKLKLALSETTLKPSFTSNALQKLKKRYCLPSVNNINITPKALITTKIKSRNGKSLKLIRKNILNNPSSMSEKLNNFCTILKTKLECKPQSSKSSLCIVQNKYKRSQFSKINLVSKNTSTDVANQQVNEKSDFSSKNTLTKAALIGKKDISSGYTAEITQNKNCVDHVKFIMSKYRLTRQSSLLSCKNKSNNRNANSSSHLNRTKKLPQPKNHSEQIKYIKSKYRLRRQSSSVSRTKLLNKAVNTVSYRSYTPKTVQNNNLTEQVRYIKSKYHLRRQYSSLGSLYKIQNKHVQAHNLLSTTKSLQNKNLSEHVKYIKSKYRLTRKTSNLINRNKLNSRVILTKKVQWKPQQRCKRRITRKDLSIKNINGVFYRCSRTTLTKNKTTLKKVSQYRLKSALHPQKKFKIDNRQPLSLIEKKKIGRKFMDKDINSSVYTAGMFWTKTSQRTARSILTQAKQKSIFLLSQRRKKNNEPCIFYHRFGKCEGHKNGSCVRLHDKKFVAVCKRYIQGNCTDIQCPLNHEPSSHNMPTCQHFLAGQCGRDNCPYSHIKVSDTAPICVDLLRGYCSLGEQCLKRHIEICPSFEKGSCARGKYCPYPHPKSKVCQVPKGKFKRLKREAQPPRDQELVSNSDIRYFESETLQKENQTHLHLEDDQQTTRDSLIQITDGRSKGEETWRYLDNRPKIGELPSFIPLSLNSDNENT